VKKYLNGRERSRLKKAFSMVEMALAMAIVSFAMVSLLGLIPVGLKITRDTLDITVQSQVFQLISNQIQLTDYKNMSQWNGQKLYFDSQGLPQTDPAKSVFEADLNVQNVSTDTMSDAISQDNASLVVIKISSIQRPQSNWTTSLIIANSGRLCDLGQNP